MDPALISGAQRQEKRQWHKWKLWGIPLHTQELWSLHPCRYSKPPGQGHGQGAPMVEWGQSRWPAKVPASPASLQVCDSVTGHRNARVSFGQVGQGGLEQMLLCAQVKDRQPTEVPSCPWRWHGHRAAQFAGFGVEPGHTCAFLLSHYEHSPRGHQGCPAPITWTVNTRTEPSQRKAR